MSTDGYGFVRRHALENLERARGNPENSVSMRPVGFSDANLRTNPYLSVSPGVGGGAPVDAVRQDALPRGGSGETSPECGKPRLRFFVSRLLKKEETAPKNVNAFLSRLPHTPETRTHRSHGAGRSPCRGGLQGGRGAPLAKNAGHPPPTQARCRKRPHPLPRLRAGCLP